MIPLAASTAADRAAFRFEIPERFNFTADVIDRWAADPAKLAMLWTDGRHERRVTFAALAEGASRFGDALLRAGLKPGDRLFLMMGREVAWWQAVLGAFKAGIVPMPATTQLRSKDIAYRIQAAGAVAALADPASAMEIDLAHADGLRLRILAGAGPEVPAGWTPYEDLVADGDPHRAFPPTLATDPALLYFTSGTTGNPKMVLHNHAYPLGHTVTGRFWLDLGPDDLHWNISDTGWAKAAWSSLFAPWLQGAAIIVDAAPGRFDPRRTLQMLQDLAPTSLCAAPTIYRMLVLEDLTQHRYPRLRSCVSAGEPLNPEVIETWRRGTGLTIRDGYGQTETVCVVGNFPDLPLRPGSMGKPCPGFDVQIIDDQGQPLPAGQEGDIAVRVKPEIPPGVFHGYYKDPEGTASRMVGDYYITGDRGIRDEDGYLWFVGRADDVILSAAYRIGPFEVESALMTHPAVAEAAVVSSPDPIRGSIVKAFVVTKPGAAATAAELQAHVQKVTAPYKYPREVEFVAELPKTVSGKIKRFELRALENARKRQA
ncbi:MAG TPA: AMP-binding protein [Bacillota bacterium]|nr:AMP-binding protein [Bacillota bacterium]